MEFWRRHRRKIFVSCGVLGGGYFLYKLYDAHTQRLAELESEQAREQEKDEIIKRQLLEHFANIQTIADSTTLPHTIQLLHTHLMDELDLTSLRDRLLQGKSQSSSVTSSEKLELWERLKIQSFTRTVLSLWALTTLSLYVRVQVNILGRHLYIDTARGLGSFLPLVSFISINSVLFIVCGGLEVHNFAFKVFVPFQASELICYPIENPYSSVSVSLCLTYKTCY
ncbi:unnamed protein product [Rhodiola kirilowii]